MITQIIDYNKRRLWIRHDIQNIREKLKQCDIKPLSTSQKKDIESYWQKLVNKKIPYYWHEYFYSRNDFFSVQYVPTCLYHSDVVFQLNYRPFASAYVDKNLYDIYFSDVLRPKTIIKNINGFFYDDSKAISVEEAVARCKNLSGAVIKPSLDGMWGRGVKVFSSQNGQIEGMWTVEKLIKDYGSNFIIQEKVEQHRLMSKLNHTSLNTLRVLSFRRGTEVFILYAVVRIGRKGKSVDNETAGGINADIDLNRGKVISCAYGTPGEKKIYTTDCGMVLKDFEIPAFHQVLDIVKELHLRLPYFQIVGWDFGIDLDGRPVMIEWNRAPDLSQTAHGPAFGEMTEMIFKECRCHPDSYFIHLY